MLNLNEYRFLVLPEYILKAMVEHQIDVTKLVNDLATYHEERWNSDSVGYKIIQEWGDKLTKTLGKHTMHEVYAFNSYAPSIVGKFLSYDMLSSLTINSGYNQEMWNKEIYNNMYSSDRDIKFEDTYEILIGDNAGVIVLKDGFNYLIDNELEFVTALIGVVETMRGADTIYKDKSICCEYIRLINKK